MTMNERIIQAVKPVVPVCVPDLYDPNQNEAAEEFCVFSYDAEWTFYADNSPMYTEYSGSLNWALPLKKASLVKKANLQRTLERAGFDLQGIYNTSTEEFQMYEFQWSYTDFFGGEP